MLEYEISNNNQLLGKVRIYNDINILNNSFIETKKNTKYRILKDGNLQTYIINITVDNEDELYDKINIYKKDNVLDEIEIIKKYNDIKHIKKDTTLSIIIPSSYLKRFNVSLESIDLISLLNSKINFIKNVLIEKNNTELTMKLNDIIINYNNMKNSNEYEFLTEEEKNKKVNKIIEQIDTIINELEENTTYKYGQNFITPIRINNQ